MSTTMLEIKFKYQEKTIQKQQTIRNQRYNERSVLWNLNPIEVQYASMSPSKLYTATIIKEIT